MYADIFRGILIPFLGTALGAACVFFMKRTLSTGIQRADGICCRHHDRGFGVEPVDSGNGAKCRYGKAGVFAGSDRLPGGNPLSAGAGSPDPASAHEQQ